MTIRVVSPAPQGRPLRHPDSSAAKKSAMLTGLSASGIYDPDESNKFPQVDPSPGGKAVAWLFPDVQEWQRQLHRCGSGVTG